MRKSALLIALFVAMSASLCMAQEKKDMPKWEKELKAKLEQPITFEFDNTPLTEVIKLLQMKSKFNVLIDPKSFEDDGVVPPITLKVENMKFETALQWIVKIAGLEYEIRDEMIYIHPKKASNENNPDGQDEMPQWEKEIRAKMKEPVTFEFDGTPLTEVIKLLTQKSGLNILIEPRVFEATGGVIPPVTLKVENMKLETAMKWVMRLTGLDYEFRDQVVYIAMPSQLLGDLERRIYDISDLTKKSNLFVAEIVIKTDKAQMKQIFSSERIIDMIQSVMPETWASESISVQEPIPNMLVINHHVKVHDKIADTLNLLRQHLNRVVNVKARFISMPEKDAKNLLDKIENENNLVNDSDLKKILEGINNGTMRSLGFHNVSLYNGQKGISNANSTQSYIKSYEIEGEKISKKIEDIKTGSSINIMGAVVPDTKMILLKIDNTLADLDQFIEKETPQGPIQLPKVKVHSWTSSIYVPKGGTVALISGTQENNNENWVIIHLITVDWK